MPRCCFAAHCERHLTPFPRQHLHKKGSIALSRAWPLGSLMKAYEGGGTPQVVDVGASIGYFRYACTHVYVCLCVCVFVCVN